MGEIIVKTSKPISTISYNSPEFLRQKINYWKELGIIEYGMWIRHEPDEDNKKAHYHVFLKPAKLIQTMDLENDSMEFPGQKFYDTDGVTGTELVQTEVKPLKMIGFRMSKEDDWILYGIHDPTYLAEKGMTRNVHYSFNDIETTCIDTLHDMITHLIDNRKGRLEVRIFDLIQKDFSWRDIVTTGIVPLKQMHNAFMFYRAITMQVDDYRNSQPKEQYEEV